VLDKAEIESYYQFQKGGRGVRVIVCLCRGVSDRTIAKVIADGARTADEVGQVCGAGTSCGSCLPTVERMCRRACEECAEADATPTSQAA
jgi:bacterioferritin-associated ferredoxin